MELGTFNDNRKGRKLKRRISIYHINNDRNPTDSKVYLIAAALTVKYGASTIVKGPRHLGSFGLLHCDLSCFVLLLFTN